MSYTDFNQQKVVWDVANLNQYQATTDMVLSEYDYRFPLLEHIPLKCELFSRLLVRAAELTLESKPAKTSARKRTKPSPTLHKAWLKMRKAFGSWKASGKVKDSACKEYEAYRESKRLFQCRYRMEAELNYIQNNNTIMKADKTNKKQFFNIIRNIRRNKQNKSPSILNTPAGTYHGQDTLEGFTVDAELLSKPVGEAAEFDHDFYKLCVLDILYIFEFKGTDAIRIPKMKISDLECILNKEMKLGKACDIYHLTTEHLRYACHS